MKDEAVRVVFHAGFHKTGTTTLQKTLSSHRQRLKPSFAVETRPLSPRFTAAAEAARSYSADPGPEQEAALRGSLQAWVGGLQLAPGQGLLASSEDFAGHMPGNQGVWDYSAAPAIAAAIAGALRGRFAAALQLSFLYTTRDPARWLRSIHWQLSKHPRMEMMADRFCQKHAAAADFGAVLQAVRARLPGIDVVDVPLESLTDRRLGPAEAIYDLAGIGEALRKTLNRVPPENQSPPYDLADAYVALNRARVPRDALRRLKLALLASAELDRDLGE